MPLHRVGDGPGAARVPDVEQHQRLAAHMQGMERVRGILLEARFCAVIPSDPLRYGCGRGRMRFQLGRAFLAVDSTASRLSGPGWSNLLQRVVAGGAGFLGSWSVLQRSPGDWGSDQWDRTTAQAPLSKTLATGQRAACRNSRRRASCLLERGAEMAVTGEAEIGAQRVQVFVLREQVQRTRQP